MSSSYSHRYNEERVKNYVKSVNWSKRLDKEMPFLVDHFKSHNFTEILDFGCGPGIHATHMAKTHENFRITGFDIDENMLAYANEQLKSENLPNLTFVQGDFLIDSLEPMKEKVDVLYTLGNALMILWSNTDTNLIEIFKKLSYFIKPGGGLFFQILNSDNPRDGHIVSRITKDADGLNQIFIKHFMALENNLYSTFSTLKWGEDESDIKVTESRKGCLKLVPLEQLKSYMQEAGFKDFIFYEDYDGKPLQADSDALMCFATKK